MAIDENGIYIPKTIKEINEELQAELVAAGVSPNVFETSNYIQTTNPIVTAIYNLQANIAAFPNQIQKIFSLQNILIERAGINTVDAVYSTIIKDVDIDKCSVRNITPGEVIVSIWSAAADLLTKDYAPLTQEVVDVTSVFGQYQDLGGAISATATRPSSVETTTVYYNLAIETLVDAADPLNLLTVNISTFFPLDVSRETEKVDTLLKDTFAAFKIGQALSESFLVSKIFDISEGRYSAVDVNFSGTAAQPANGLFVYVSAAIIFS